MICCFQGFEKTLKEMKVTLERKTTKVCTPLACISVCICIPDEEFVKYFYPEILTIFLYRMKRPWSNKGRSVSKSTNNVSNTCNFVITLLL